MNELREIFRFSHAELIALSVLLTVALIGGGILLLQRMQEQIPAEVVFEPIEVNSVSVKEKAAATHSSSRLASSGESAGNSKSPRLGVDFKININTAPAESLMMLPHVGSVIANRIIAYRESHGAFDTPNQLIAVRGIGPRNLQEIQPYVTAK